MYLTLSAGKIIDMMLSEVIGISPSIYCCSTCRVSVAQYRVLSQYHSGAEIHVQTNLNLVKEFKKNEREKITNR